MSNIAIFKQGKTPEYLTSVNTGEYVVDPNITKDQVVPSDPDILINPDISAVKDVPLKYWKRNGNSIVEMNQSEKDALNQAELDEKEKLLQSLESIESITLAKALVKSGLITKAQLITAIKQVI